MSVTVQTVSLLGRVTKVEAVGQTENGNVIRRAYFDSGLTFDTLPDASVTFIIEEFVGRPQPYVLLEQVTYGRRGPLTWAIVDLRHANEDVPDSHWSRARPLEVAYRVDDEGNILSTTNII